MQESPVLLYDGGCGFCAANVQFVLRHDRKGTLRFAALQSPFGLAVAARHPELRGIDSMVWVDPAAPPAGERVSTRSEAALRVMRYLGGIWTIFTVARLVPRPLRDGVYDVIARHRHALARRRQCLTPAPGTRARFIDR
jgi:predicted DCC family thiol-disulfide oxidoreductase YuxK